MLAADALQSRRLRLRLQYADDEPPVANRTPETVARVATEWGFAHTGRYAVMDRDADGQSPRTSLRAKTPHVRSPTAVSFERSAEEGVAE